MALFKRPASRGTRKTKPVVDSRFPPSESSGFMLWRGSLEWQRHVRQVLDPHEITHVQFAALASAWWLAQASDEVTQRQVATYTGIEETSCSQVLRRMESAGLVRRIESTRDTRARRVEITDAGLETLAATLPEVQRIGDEFFGQLGQREHEFRGDLHALVSSSGRSVLGSSNTNGGTSADT